MSQFSLFDADDSRHLTPLGVPGSAVALTAAQKQFNKLIARINVQREELLRWRDFISVFQKRHAEQLAPVNVRLRQARIAMIMVLDEALSGKALSKNQRARAIEILLGQLAEVMGSEPSEELLQIHDKYNDLSFDEEQQSDVEFMRSMASDVFGVELDDDDLPASPEALARMMDEKMQADAEAARASKKPRKKSAKALAQEAVREQAEHGASRALRDIYRKLVSDLHPDREPDVQRRAEKTALMQKVNEAYDGGDLLALLELQLSIEQIHPDSLKGMAEEKLIHFNHVLKEQSRRLDDELSDLTMPFAQTMGMMSAKSLTPTLVLQSIDTEVQMLVAIVAELETDTLRYRDVRELKRDLRHHALDSQDDDLVALVDNLMQQSGLGAIHRGAVQPRGGKGKRRR